MPDNLRMCSLAHPVYLHPQGLLHLFSQTVVAATKLLLQFLRSGGPYLKSLDPIPCLLACTSIKLPP